MSKKLNIALIGCGYWGKNYLRLFEESYQTNIALVCDKNPRVQDMVASNYPGVEFSTDYRAAVANWEIDAAVVATVTEQHYAIAKDLIAAGKHVLIEKPMTTKASEGRHLIELARERNVKLMVGHIYLYNSAIQQAKQYLKESDLGKLHYFYTQRTNLGPIRHDVNVVWDLAPHDVSILNYFMDSDPLWVSAVGQNLSSSKHADVAFIVLGYPDNVVGHIHVSWADPSKVRDVVIVGSHRRIYLNDMDPQEPIRIFERGLEPSAEDTALENRFTIRDGDIISPRVKLSEPLREQCNHFVNAILQDREPISNGQNGVSVVQVLEAIDQSMQDNGRRINIGEQMEVVYK